MKTKKLILPLLCCMFFFQWSTAQDLITIKHSCSFDGEELDEDLYSFDASSEADRIVLEIVNAVGLQKNFVVKSANCKNALAATDNGNRYILYNTSFLEDFKKDAKTKWAAYCVLAHEIGHHLNGHNFKETDNRKRKKWELEADIFAGSVMYALGANLEEAKAGIDLLQSNGETATHPPARARAEAIASGWKKRQESNGRRTQPTEPIAESTTTQPSPANSGTTSTTPPPKKTEQPIEQPDEEVSMEQLTEVSDQLTALNLVGFWNCSFYDDLNQLISTNIGLYPDYSMRVETYLDGVLSSTVIETWSVSKGQFIETASNSIYYKYNLQFTGTDIMNATFVETNGAAIVPIGTTFIYNRIQ